MGKAGGRKRKNRGQRVSAKASPIARVKNEARGLAKKAKDKMESKAIALVLKEATPIVSSAALSVPAFVASHPMLAAGVGAFGLTASLTMLVGYLAVDAKRFTDEAKGNDTDEEFEEKIKTPSGAKASVDAAREFLESRAPKEIAKPLGRLLKRYLDKKKTPDTFFRGCSRLLSDVTPEEFVALQRVVAKMCECIDGNQALRFSYGDARDASPIHAKGPVVRLLAPIEDEQVETYPLERIPLANQVHRMLAAHGLADFRPGGPSSLMGTIEFEGKTYFGGDMVFSDDLNVVVDVPFVLHEILFGKHPKKAARAKADESRKKR